MPFDNVPLGEPIVKKKRLKKQPKLTETQRALLRAADIIEWRGWCRDELTLNGRFCIIGGIQAAVLEGRTSERMVISPLLSKAIQRVEDYMQKTEMLDYCERLYEWNDGQATSGRQVVKVLRKAAEFNP